MIVAQLVERLLPTPEVRGLNLVIGKFSIQHYFTVNRLEKTKMKKKEAGKGQYFLRMIGLNSIGPTDKLTCHKISKIFDAAYSWQHFTFV